MKEAAEFAESTQILMNVSEFTDVSTATDTLISAVQAFGYTAETSMEVVDLMNTIGNNYAISTADLATSLTKSSASLVAAGGDLAEAAALTATANAIIQDADSVGTALKTTSLRLRGTSVEELEKEGVDSDGAVESTSKLQSKIKALSGVDILTETGEYKSTYQILSQIADVWADINDMDQAALLELLAGKRNASVLAAILQAPEDLKAAYEDAQNAEGSALEENERYLDSIQGKIDQFNNAMQAMWSNALDSDWVKGFVSLGTQLIKIIDSVGLLQTILFGLFTYLSNKKNSNLDLASMLGIHDKEKGWTFGQEGLTGKIKEKFAKKSVTEDILGDPADVEVDVKEYADAISDNINDYVRVDTSQIDTQIEDIQNKLMVARDQLDDAKSVDWDYYKSLGSDAPAKDRDDRIAEKQNEISSLEAQLTTLQAKRSETMSDAALKYADANINGIKAEAQAQRSLFEALDKVRNVKLSMGNEQDAALKIDQINQAASQGQVALSQYAATLGDSDIAIQAYIASLNGEQASLAGFNQFIQQHNAGIKASGIAAKAAAVGHAVLNAAISMGISLLISGAISLISSWVNAMEEAADAAKDAMDAYKTANETLRKNKKTIKDISKDYEKLADGVDDLGNNISLTTEEYERYNEITNQIADMFPHLVSGYTEEGNAILRVKGNVEALTEAYEKEARAARDAVLAESENIVKTSNNTIKDSFWASSDGFWGNILKDWSEVYTLNLVQAEASATNIHDLSKYLAGDLEALDEKNSKLGQAKGLQISRILQTLKKAGADVSFWDVRSGSEDVLNRVVEENRDIVDSVINVVDSEIRMAATNNRSIIDAYLGNDSHYAGLDDKTKSLINQVVQNIDDEFLISFKSNAELFGWVQSKLVGQLGNLDDDTQNQISLGFDLVTKLNSGDVTVGEYESQIQAIISLIDALDLRNEDEILKSFRVVFNIDEDGKVDAAKQNVVKNILEDEYDSNVINLTKEDLDIVDKNLKSWKIPDGTLLSWDELKQKIEETKALAWEAGVDFEKTSKALDSIQDAYSTLSNAVTEYNTNGFLTLDSLQSILSLEPEYLAALQMENGQLTINQGVLQTLIQTRLAEAKATVIQSAMEQLHALAAKTAADEVNNSAIAASNAVGNLGEYASALGTVAKDAIAAAGAVTALNAAVAGAKANELVDQSEIDTILTNMNNSLFMIDELGAGLSTNFKEIVAPSKDTDTDADSALEALQKRYERLISNLDNQQQHIQNQIDILEAQEESVSASYYEEQIALEEDKIDLYEQEREELLKLNRTDEVAERLWEVEHAIQESTLRMIEFRKSIVDLYDAAFDKVNGAYDNQEDFLQDQQDYIEKYAELNDEYAGSAIKANIGIQEDKLEDSQNRLNALREAFRIASTDGYTDENGNFVPYLEEGSEAWVKMQDEIREAEAAVLDNQLAIKKYKEELADLAADRFSGVVSAHDDIDELYSDRQSYIEKQMEMENTTDSQKKSGYRELIELENKKLSDNQTELGRLIQLRDQYVADGTIETGSEQWIEMEKQIRATEAAIQDNNASLEEYSENLKQLEVDAFKKIRDAFSQKDDFYSSQQSYVEGYISHLEALGIGVPEEAYEGLIDIEKKKQENNLSDLVDARQGLKDLEAQGFDVASDEWKDAYANIVALEKKIQDSDIAMAQWAKTIRDMNFEKFDTYIGRIDDISGKLENLYNLTSKEDVATEDGLWTSDGLTSLGLLYQQMASAQVKVEEYADKINELNKAYENGEMSESEYYGRLIQLEDGQWDAINAYESAKESMVDMEETRIDMIEEGINKEIEAYEELINLKKEELDAERDLYEFKKNIQKQSKDIASLERRISALSGSTNANDIAERRKLQAELYEAQEGLNDTYYDHSRDQQGQALDDEMEAFRTAKEEYVESLRETLENMGAVVNNLISTVLYHSETVLAGMESTASEHGITLSGSLTGPWTSASNSVTAFDAAVTANMEAIKTTIENSTAPLTGELGLPWNSLTEENGPIDTFSDAVGNAIDGAKQKAIDNKEDLKNNIKEPFDEGSGAANTFSGAAENAIANAAKKANDNATALTNNLTSPWTSAENAANTFSQTVAGILEGWAEKAETEAARVKAATTITYPGYIGNGDGSGENNTGGADYEGTHAQKKYYTTATLKIGSNTLTVTRSDSQKAIAERLAKTAIAGEYERYQKTTGRSEQSYESAWLKTYRDRVKYDTKYYAKGTTGTTRDEWALTDEPQFGDELVLVPGKDGNLSFMRKGTGVVPADLTQKLFELAQIPTSDLMNKSMTAIVPNVTRNDFKNEFNFESLVHVDTVDSDTLPKLEKMVDKKIDDFSKALNYSIKRFAR